MELTALIPFILPLAAAGVLAGLMAGLLGVGGGIVIVPALYFIFAALDVAEAVRIHTAVGTSLAAIILTGYSSARAQAKKGALDMPTVWLLAPSMAVGSVVGALIAPHLGTQFLLGFFGCFMLLIAAQMGLGQKGLALATKLPSGAARHSLGGGIGLVSSLLGVGGGTMTVPTLAACGYAMHTAVAAGSALGLAIAIPGASASILTGWGAEGLPPFSLGYVNLLALAIIAPLSALMAPLGVKLSHRLSPAVLKKVFAVVLAIIALRMVAKALF